MSKKKRVKNLAPKIAGIIMLLLMLASSIIGVLAYLL